MCRHGNPDDQHQSASCRARGHSFIARNLHERRISNAGRIECCSFDCLQVESGQPAWFNGYRLSRFDNDVYSDSHPFDRLHQFNNFYRQLRTAHRTRHHWRLIIHLPGKFNHAWSHWQLPAIQMVRCGKCYFNESVSNSIAASNNHLHGDGFQFFLQRYGHATGRCASIYAVDSFCINKQQQSL
jgi:hypothetical protein